MLGRFTTNPPRRLYWYLLSHDAALPLRRLTAFTLVRSGGHHKPLDSAAKAFM